MLMKITTTICAAWLAACVVGCVSDDQARLKGEAKIGRAEAEKIALAQAPNGTIKEGELEKEKGRLIWSFDIATPGSNDTTEVNVDARTGQVVAVTKESPEQEKKEGKEQK
jgi:uncharacterized membrane protein YkoI